MPLTLRLSLLQWCQNSVFAAAMLTLGTYMLQVLDFSGREVGLVYATVAIAASVTPPIIGWLADRHFSPNQLLIGLSLAAAAALVACFFTTTFLPFYGLFLSFNLCSIPTFSLLSSICFHQLERPAEQFPFVRAWGTVGFIVIAIALSVFELEVTAWPLIIGAGMSVLVAVFALTLDKIPPQPSFSWSDLKGEEVGRIIREPGMAVLMVAMLLSCVPSAFYYSFVNPFLNEVGWSAAAAKMSLGQFVEVALLFSMPFVLRKIRFKWIVFCGLLLWGARYFAFAYGRPEAGEWLLYAGILVQGFCFVWIVVAGQIYVDKRVPKGLRSTAQGLVTFANQGVGLVLGSWLAGEVVGAYEVGPNLHDWRAVWMIPGVVGVVTALGFWALFPRAGRL